MATLPLTEIKDLLEPFLSGAEDSPEYVLTPTLLDQFSTYLDLLLLWNRHVSLTSMTEPREIVRRHFGEGLFAGMHLGQRIGSGGSVLDYGTGAGFPGVPLQLLLPQAKVTLAESQTRKVAFLREVVRTLSLPTEIWPRRVEEMPVDRRFQAVTLRAVDKMSTAVQIAETRVAPDGWMAVLAGAELPVHGQTTQYPLPESNQRSLQLWQPHVPRGT